MDLPAMSLSTDDDDEKLNRIIIPIPRSERLFPLIQTHFLNDAERSRFVAWLLCQRIPCTNFFNHDSRKDLLDVLFHGNMPEIPLGRNAAGTYFRLGVDPHSLVSNQGDEPDFSYHEEYLAPFVMAATPQRRRDAKAYVCVSRPPAASDGDSDSAALRTPATSAPIPDHTLLFHQLGPIEYLPAFFYPDTTPANSQPWDETGYVLVARFSLATGRATADGLYAIFNRFPVMNDYCDVDDRYGRPVGERVVRRAWRVLDGGEGVWECARLDGVEGLEVGDGAFERPLEWRVEIEGPVDLLHVGVEGIVG